MAEIHYLISDASKQVDVEAHVLRYWEEELELPIPRNELGHRYYTEFHIRLFRQVKALKEKGYQLKAIKSALEQSRRDQTAVPGEILEAGVQAALKETGIGERAMTVQERGKNGQFQRAGEKSGSREAAKPEPDGKKTEGSGSESKIEAGAEVGTGKDREKPDAEEQAQESALARRDPDGLEALLAGKKMEQFQRLMNHVIGRAMEENSEKLSQDVSYLVHDKLMKEMEYLMRVSDEREEERFRRLDETIRACQRDSQGRAEAAAAFSGFPFFRLRKKKYGRNGNKL